MLDKIIVAITDLPVILQGALGSALFALTLFLGQKTAAYVSNKISLTSIRYKENALIDEQAMLNVIAAKNIEEETYYAVVSLYRAGRYATRSMFWLILGLIFGSIIPVFEMVGYLGGLYYILQVMRVFQGTSASKDEAKFRIEQIDIELNQLDKNHGAD